MARPALEPAKLDSYHFTWHRRAGLFLAVRYLQRHRVPVVETPLSELPQFSRRMIALALRLSPTFLDRADLDFPIIVAGRGWSQVALDGRHRISKATWTGATHLRTVRVPWHYALELLTPGVFEVEWLYLFLRQELRRAGHRPPSGAAGAPPPPRGPAPPIGPP